jgi:RNA polymerase sigma factor (sigma-70 family)
LRWRRVVQAADPEAYVRRILVNEHISWWRRFGRRELPFGYHEKEKSGSDPAEAAVQRLDLAAALARLPKRQRAVIVLRFYEDLTEAATAAAMGCTIGTVKAR